MDIVLHLANGLDEVYHTDGSEEVATYLPLPDIELGDEDLVAGEPIIMYTSDGDQIVMNPEQVGEMMRRGGVVGNGRGDR